MSLNFKDECIVAANESSVQKFRTVESRIIVLKIEDSLN